LKNVHSIEDGYVTVAVCVNGIPEKDESGQDVTTRIKLEKDPEDSDWDDEQSAQILTFMTDTRFEDGLLELKVKVVDEDTSKTRDYHTQPPNSALLIAGLGMNCSKAYPFAFGVVCPNPTKSTPGIVQAFMSRGPQTSGINRKRKALKMSL